MVREVCPELLIDADNWLMPNIEQWRQYMAVSAEAGVPALYFAPGLPGEPFDGADYSLIRRSWATPDEPTA